MDEVVEALEKYHGLVPLVYDIETMSLVEARSEDMQYAVYLKREADKVIAKLEENLDTTEKLLNKTLDCISNGKNHMMSLARKCNHANYKRCLAMARLCERKRVDAANYRIPRETWEFYDKWHRRWLAIAEKFKPNN